MKPKRFFVVAMALLMPAIARADPPPPEPASSTGAVTITRRGTAPSLWAPDEFFTGSVRIAPLFQATPPAQASGASVTFDPGARTMWHTHPLGQTLIVTAGHGWVQQWGGPVTEVESGDVVRIPPGVKSWHGATATASLTHIAIQESLNGRTVEMLEPVNDEQYQK